MSAKNTHKPWDDKDVAYLRTLVKENTPTRVIGIKLGRTPEAIYSKASVIGLSVKPVNKSPYGIKKSRLLD